VNIVSYGNWFGGIYIDEKNFFANFAVEPKSYLDLYPEFMLSPAEADAFLRDRKGFIAGRKLVEKYGWKIGTTVTLKGTIYPGNWDFVLRGIYRGKDKTTDETQFMFHWDYLNETMKKTVPRRADQVGFYVIGVTHPDLASAVAISVDTLFKNSLAETLTETEKAFVLTFIAMTEAILTVIQAVSLFVILIILAVVANTMVMTTRERIGEYAVMKTLGFGGWHLAAIIFGESLVVTTIGCALGIALTFPAAQFFSESLSTYFPIFYVEPNTLLLDCAAATAVGLIAAIIPTHRAVTIRIADGLRRLA
jgi:putative ABC transport system permease protein